MQIKLENVGHTYQKETPVAVRALYDINTLFTSGQFIAVIGHTGSGKSTLLQHLNALLIPTEGRITIGEQTIYANQKRKNLKEIHRKVGIVFQFPEHQLFEETVEKDICFGPINFGVSEADAKQNAREVLQLVGLTEDILQKSPFELSGGQMRRVAIAGILAMEPEVLVLDEPTAGLDPLGSKMMMDMFYHLHHSKKLTTVLVTHHMEDATAYADEIFIMHQGTIVSQGKSNDIFANPQRLIELGLSVPNVLQLQLQLEKKGFIFSKIHFDMKELVDEIYEKTKMVKSC